MPKHYALNGYRCGCNGVCPEQTGNGPKYEPANATEPIAATAALPATLQLSSKYCSMPLLVCAELGELWGHLARSEPGHDDLGCVDAGGAMLASMIDPNDAVTEVCHVRPNT
ncbi:hypothetical protein WCE39_13550 [Luteimonas sp. MJ174]|uniref:hypothetical protein n=1 Tax=Luteimonas sp. MJ174 TaxID=3129237 RepID=UPI0031BAF242